MFFRVVTSQHRNYLQALVHNLNLQCTFILSYVIVFIIDMLTYIKHEMHDKS
jgi:hypothetical protein